jgi:acetoin utilization protein AcuB
MEIKKIKVHNVLKCRDIDTVNHISKLLKEKNERRIFVVDENNKLNGIITTTDLVYKVLAFDNKNLTAKEIMTKNVQSVDISEDINKALEVMNKIKSYSCPLTDKGKLVGLLSYHDIVGHVMKTIGE